ncbi:hypothetical protein RBH26_10855 [Natronolimnohabitans sp. A-GB9]|uniref:helix-turn-helix transcriptional regulator n=1 Tax=Natronolimnohabitans sp. A-GB9 TaxID=3069757 RepID=UPI0027B60D45|nr:hypothetical protein [Natronolimnohabitans sp. A-GB9]MDQ2050978.1 hypothetical protein [Natronolimnohabitans sp. A-GB9]
MSTSSSAEPDPKQVIRVSIDESGDAQWTIESRFLLTDDDDIDDFDDWAERVTAGERNVAYDRQWFEARASDAADRTDREMSIENARWDDPRVQPAEDDPIVDTESADIEDDDQLHVGVISYSVTWTNFATAENDRLYVGDTFDTPYGVWLSLSADQRLVIEYPDDYALETPTQLEWDGPYEFTEDELEIIFVQSGGGDGGIDLSTVLGGGLAVLVIGVVVGVFFLIRRGTDADLPEPLDRVRDFAGGRPRSGSSAGGDGRKADVDRRRDVDSPPETTGTSSDAATGTELEFKEGIDNEIDPELLSDEERVLRLLKRNGGRMKQAAIVAETGWSDAKVSQLLSQMDDEGDIEKLRIGRENLITLPEVEPTEIE